MTDTAERQSWSWSVFASVEKYDPDQTAWAEERAGLHQLPSPGPNRRLRLAKLLRSTGEPGGGTEERHGNIISTQGLDQITKLLIGTSATVLNTTHGICGVGQGNLPAPSINDTALIADNTVLAFYQGFDATWPQQANGTISAQATFASGVAQFTWNEWCWAASTGTVGASNRTILHDATGSGGWAGATTQYLWNHAVPAPSIGTKGAVAWLLATSATIA